MSFFCEKFIQIDLIATLENLVSGSTRDTSVLILGELLLQYEIIAC
jgi:hypothetical protein